MFRLWLTLFLCLTCTRTWAAVSISITSPTQSVSIYEGTTKTIYWNIKNTGTESVSLSGLNGELVDVLAPVFIGGEQKNQIVANSIKNQADLKGQLLPGSGLLVASEIVTGDHVPSPRVADRKVGSWNVKIQAKYYATGDPQVKTVESASPVRVDILDYSNSLNPTGGVTQTYMGSFSSMAFNGADTQPYQSLGWSFSLSQPKLVNSLGFWDEGQDGIEDHRVALWNAVTGLKLAETTVTSSSTVYGSRQSTGNWLYQQLGRNLYLAPGTYVVGAQYRPNSPDAYRISDPDHPITLNSDPHVTYLTARSVTQPTSFGSFLEFPDAISSSNTGYFGPNALLASVPETSSLITLGGLLASLCGIQHLRNRRVKSS